ARGVVRGVVLGGRVGRREFLRSDERLHALLAGGLLLRHDPGLGIAVLVRGELELDRRSIGQRLARLRHDRAAVLHEPERGASRDQRSDRRSSDEPRFHPLRLRDRPSAARHSAPAASPPAAGPRTHPRSVGGSTPPPPLATNPVASAPVPPSSRRTLLLAGLATNKPPPGPKSSAVGPSSPPLPLATTVGRNPPLAASNFLTVLSKNDAT